MKRAIEDVVAVLAGVGMGSAIMYLLDPDQGPHRRQTITDGAHHAVAEAGQTIAEIGQHLAEQAQLAASGLHDGAEVQGHHAAEMLNGYKNRAYAALSNAPSHLPDLSALQHRLQKGLRTQMKNYGHQRGASQYVAPAIGITAGSAALVALGVGVAYLFDPERGRGRRANLINKTTACLNDAGKLARSTGRHLSNKVYGQAMEASRPLRKMRQRWQDESSSKESSNARSETSESLLAQPE